MSVLVSASAFAQTTDQLLNDPRRVVTLEGTSNFRDLGGYPTKDGHHVKWGHLYRSADIGHLTDADLEQLTDRHITVVCDLRGPDEIRNSPDRLPAGAVWHNMPAGSESTQAMLGSVSNKPVPGDSLMLAFYSRTDHLKAKYKPMFDQLLALDSSKALLFHCTAGKDRTGIGAALLLSALGVERPLVMADYHATNQFWRPRQSAAMKRMTQPGVDTTAMKAMLVANPAYLQRTFDAIQRQYGSVDQFLTREMDLTPDRLALLRRKYLN
ncbi:protein-tyrosine phosphatase [Spirosoma oryzae]|uniref:Protein-tyrosine phosphatase n=1 Tax=Spirosoma oryzae TaxID=1469603 RepID=A0A2T0RHY1_9BACT|nr:tyrosine-protein phosphatase [Spirosoma oryzae]PRY20759.1 protein-tyrosine phosphatase [Spirosoma oryzae]